MMAAIVSHRGILTLGKYRAMYLAGFLVLMLIPYSIWLEASSPLGVNKNEYLWLLIPSLEGILFASIIYLLFESCARFPEIMDSTLTKVSIASYSLYLLHPAALELAKWLGAYLELDRHWDPALAALGIATSFAIADVSYQVIERPFLTLKKGERK